MLKIIQQLQQFICTAYGDSDLSFGLIEGLPSCEGSGHGNGTSSGIWAGISTVLLNSLREEGYEVQYITTISKKWLTS